MAAQLPHVARVDGTIDPPHAAVECSLTHVTQGLRASVHSGVSDLTPGPRAVTNATVAAAHDPEGGPVLDDTMGEIADTLLLALDAAGVALYEWPAEGPLTTLAVRGTHSATWFSALAERYLGSLLDGTLTELA